MITFTTAYLLGNGIYSAFSSYVVKRLPLITILSLIIHIHKYRTSYNTMTPYWTGIGMNHNVLFPPTTLTHSFALYLKVSTSVSLHSIKACENPLVRSAWVHNALERLCQFRDVCRKIIDTPSNHVSDNPMRLFPRIQSETLMAPLNSRS